VPPFVFSRSDFGFSAIFAILAGSLSFYLFGLIPRELYTSAGYDVWFEADLPRVHDTMISRWGLPRASLHPLFPILTYAPTTFLIKAGLEPLMAIRVIISLVSGLWGALCFLLLRSMDCQRFDAGLFSLVALSSASAVFFFAIPETFIVGSITILFALIWAASDERGQSSPIVEAVISAMTLGSSVTNWMFGLLLAVVRRPFFGQAIQVSVNALAICVLAWTVQKFIFPLAEFF